MFGDLLSSKTFFEFIDSKLVLQSFFVFTRERTDDEGIYKSICGDINGIGSSFAKRDLFLADLFLEVLNQVLDLSFLLI